MQSIGAQPYYLQPIRIRTDALYGTSVEYTYSGRADYLLADYNLLATGGQQAEYISTNGSRADVVVRYGNLVVGGGVEVPTVAFDLRTEEIQQSIFHHPTFSDLGPAAVKIITDGAADFKGRQVTINALKAFYLDPFGVTDTVRYDKAVHAFDLLINGTDQYVVAQSYTFVMNRTASAGFGLDYYLPDDGTIFSTLGLENYVAFVSPSVIPFTLPTFNSISSGESLALVFGWRKRGTQVQVLANGNVQVQEQWQSARWSLLLYSIGSWN